MKIAVTADPEIPVPPRYYGGIERVVDLVVRGMGKRGHTVTLFANPSSSVPCRLVALPGKSSGSFRDIVRNTLTINAVIESEDYDVIHSFGRLAYLWPALLRGRNVVMTYQRAITPKSVNLALKYSRNRVKFTSVGRHLVDSIKGEWSIIPNGVDICRFSYRPSISGDSPLVFLGRIEDIKGVHLAIEVAERCGKKLVIMGNLESEHTDYFETKIKPHIDGNSVVFLGAVDDDHKNRILGGATALLMPVLWDEPFGIVMIESLACGTPVIGLRRGAVPEVIEDGVTGFICDDIEQMTAAVRRVGMISREMCRSTAETRFSQSAIVTQYENVYKNSPKKRTSPIESNG